MRALVLLTLVPMACKAPPDTDAPLDTDTDVAPPPVPQGYLTGEFCLVRTVYEVTCVTGCHSGLVPGGGLDLATDPWTATVGRPSQSQPGQQLVVAGSATDSVLYRKMTGILAGGQGDIMPPGGLLPPDVTAIVRDWIDAGAVNDCVIPAPGEGPPPPPPPPPPPEDIPQDQPYHPPGWSEPAQHGVAVNLQQGGDCRSCHGDQLAGGQTTTVSCDDCHDPGWRTNCQFCHGGQGNSAPPKDIDGVDDPALISFPPHPSHTLGAGYDCTQCHYKPTDVLYNGHIFGDVTPGYGEVYNGAGYSPLSTYAGGTCSNNYCHGNGRADNGTVSVGDGPLGCTSCHPNAGSTPAEWAQMSGRHQLHLEEVGATCSECHGNTVDAGGQIIGPTYHVNAQKDFLNGGVTFAGGSCNGTCHNFDHNNRGW